MTPLRVFDSQKSKRVQRPATSPKKVVVSVGRGDFGRDVYADAREIIQDARDEAFRIKKTAEEEVRRIHQESLDLEKRIAQREDFLDARVSQIEKREKQLTQLQELEVKKESEVSRLRKELITKLEKVASLTADEAKKLIISNLETELRDEIAKRIKEAEEKIKSQANDKAREIIANAMIAGATDWVAEYTVSVVKLESEEIKGRIIGKEGRNIRAFELATGVDVELDSEVPDEVRLSSFDPVRREIAKVALDWLIKDTRIQPARIEQLVDKAKRLVTADMSEAGRRAAAELGLFNLSQEALDGLGRLKFRYSYGQNQLIASIETAKIAKKIAEELGANVTVCTTGGLFHDIGKIEVEKEGTHVQLGVELVNKWGFAKEIVDCIAQHHEDEPFTSVESIIVHIADAVSGARPGARHEPVEQYIKRLSDIEKLASSFSGVDKVYAIAAGREVRVIVEPTQVDDAGIITLSHEIREKLEKDLTFPGQLTVTVIRETRAVDIAK